MNKICAVYARVSSALQDVENSIQAQLYACKNYAEVHKYSIFNIYIDEAKSGKDANRPAYLEMKKDARQKKFDIILADKSDRLGRNLKEVCLTHDELKKLRINLCFVQLGIIDTPEAKLLLQMKAAMDEYYLYNLGQETKKRTTAGISERLQ